MKGYASRALTLAVLAFAALLLGARPAGADGVGVYPMDISFESALRGGEYFRTIGVINDSDSERIFSFQTDSEAGRWLSFVDLQDRTKAVDSVVAPPRSEGRVLVRLLVPSDIPNGNYAGAVRVMASAGQAEPEGGAGASVNVGAEVSIEVDVTGTQKLAGSVVDMSTTDTEVGYPLRIRTLIQNSGNVQVQPEIKVAVATQATVVDQQSLVGEVIPPNESRTTLSQWDTTNAATGDYVARVSVNFAGLDLGGRDLPFKVLPRGTLTRRGELEGLELANKPNPGELAKVIATFRNTGEIETRAKFVGELYYGSSLIEAIPSQELLVLVGQAGDLEVLARVPDKGQYTIKGKVNYEGKETEVRELTFKVGVGGGGLPVWAWAGVAAVVIIAVGLVVYGRSALRRGRPQTSATIGRGG